MITVSELRIGNKVIANGLHEGRLMTVNGIDNSQMIERRVISFLEHQVGEFAKDVEPIPLTEDWLLKFGFEKDHQYYFIHEADDGISFWLELKDDSVYYETEEMRKNIKYVHQLQNLFYCLTGTELTYKELNLQK